jgi:hypothetical protein
MKIKRALFFCLAILLLACTKPVDLNPTDARVYSVYLFTLKLSQDTLLSDLVIRQYLDSNSISYSDFKAIDERFKNDLEYRKLLLERMSQFSDSAYVQKELFSTYQHVNLNQMKRDSVK